MLGKLVRRAGSTRFHQTCSRSHLVKESDLPFRPQYRNPIRLASGNRGYGNRYRVPCSRLKRSSICLERQEPRDDRYCSYRYRQPPPLRLSLRPDKPAQWLLRWTSEVSSGMLAQYPAVCNRPKVLWSVSPMTNCCGFETLIAVFKLYVDFRCGQSSIVNSHLIDIALENIHPKHCFHRCATRLWIAESGHSVLAWRPLIPFT